MELSNILQPGTWLTKYTTYKLYDLRTSLSQIHELALLCGVRACLCTVCFQRVCVGFLAQLGDMTDYQGVTHWVTKRCP